MEKNYSPLESNKVYGEMPWVFFHRHMTNYFPVLDRSIRLPIYDLLALTCAKHTGAQQKELDSLLNEKEIQLQETIPTGTQILCLYFQAGTGESSKSRKHRKMVLELELPKVCGFLGIRNSFNEEYKLCTKVESN